MSEPNAMVTLRLFAAAREAAGCSQFHVAAGPCAQIVAALKVGRSERFAQVLAVSSLVCDGVRLDRTSTDAVTPGSVIDVLPPFAGG